MDKIRPQLLKKAFHKHYLIYICILNFQSFCHNLPLFLWPLHHGLATQTSLIKCPLLAIFIYYYFKNFLKILGSSSAITIPVAWVSAKPFSTLISCPEAKIFQFWMLWSIFILKKSCCWVNHCFQKQCCQSIIQEISQNPGEVASKTKAKWMDFIIINTLWAASFGITLFSLWVALFSLRYTGSCKLF